MRLNALAGLALAALLAPPATAGSLAGRFVTFTVMTWDDPAAPYLQARGRSVMVGEGIEFGLQPEGLTGGLEVVPVEVEITANRIELTYHAMGQFYAAAFNGYVLRFDTECALFENVRIDRQVTTMQLAATDVFARGGALYINTSDRQYRPDMVLALQLEIADCPLS